MSRCFNSLPDSELCFSNQIRCRLWFIIVAPLAHQSFRYISIRIPSVSQNENHPFSIASAPGDEELQVVIKVVGDWTGELRRQVDDGIVCPGIMVTVFGPYGAPAQNVFKFQSVILVCGGIGVTPFASILQFFNSNLTHDGESYDHKNPRHGQTPGRTRSMTYAENVQANYLATLHNLVHTNDVQFIWVCSDLSSLSWFTEVLQGTFHSTFFLLINFFTYHHSALVLQTFTSTNKDKFAPFASRYTSRPCLASDWTPWLSTSPGVCFSKRAAMMLSAVFRSHVAVEDLNGLTCSQRHRGEMTSK